MGATTSKRTFYVPASVDSDDGTSRLWPHFHRSPVFTAGGHEWSFSYYPDSLYNADSVDLCLQLESHGAGAVTVSSAVALADPTGSLPPLNLVKPSPPLKFEHGWRMVSHWVPKSLLAEALHQRHLPGHDAAGAGLVFEWTITVLPETPTPMPESESELVLTPDAMPIPMPMPMPMPKSELVLTPDVVPMPMPMHMLMPTPVPEVMPEAADARAGADAPTPNNAPATTEMEPPLPKVPATTAASVAPPAAKSAPSTDVTFSVGGELFHAHKAILSMRSPVFMAELSRAPAAATEAVEVDGMAPDVFDALLHYVYTDTLLATTTEEGRLSDDAAMIQTTTTRSLLVAADRYGMDGLKLLCERRLAKMVDADNVADMLALADERFCPALQDACIEFVMAPGRMRDVVASKGYQRLRMKHPSILVDVLEKSLMFPELYVQCQNGLHLS